MNYTVTQMLSQVRDERTRNALTQLLSVIADGISSYPVRDAGIVIKTAGSALSKIGATDWYGFAKGVLRKIAASTDNAAYSGTVANGKFNVFAHYIDNAGTLTTVMGTPGATLAAVKFPNRPTNKCMYGFTIINPTGTGNFVGGTTALDDATVVPNAVYVSVQGTPDPTVLA